MRVFLAGASGAIGTRLAAQLIERGHEVIGTFRSPGSAERVRALGAEPVALSYRYARVGGPVKTEDDPLDPSPPAAIRETDEPAPVREWLPVLADALGAKPPRRFPRRLARLFAGEAAVMMGTESRGASNAKARRELGWAPRHPSWRRGFAAAYATTTTPADARDAQPARG